MESDTWKLGEEDFPTFDFASLGYKNPVSDKFTEFKGKHAVVNTANGNAQQFIASFKEKIENIFKHFSEIDVMYKEWVSQKISWIEAKPKIERATKYMPKKYSKVLDLTFGEHDKELTKWDLFNALTSLNTHDTRRNALCKIVYDREIMKIMEAV